MCAYAGIPCYRISHVILVTRHTIFRYMLRGNSWTMAVFSVYSFMHSKNAQASIRHNWVLSHSSHSSLIQHTCTHIRASNPFYTRIDVFKQCFTRICKRIEWNFSFIPCPIISQFNHRIECYLLFIKWIVPLSCTS